MRARLIAVTLLVTSLLVLPAFAQDEHSLSFDGFSFQFSDAVATQLNLMQYPGDPVETAGRGFSDAPFTQFLFYNAPPAPESLFEYGGVRVYAAAHIALYSFLQEEVDALLALPTDSDELAAYVQDQTDALPFLPVVPHGQSIHARVEVVDTGSLRGIRYLTAFQAVQEPFLSGSFIYTFQGVSTDGAWYVAAVFMPTTDLFPSETGPTFEMATFAQQWDAYLAESIATLNAAQPDDFSPSLDALDAVIDSIAFAGSSQ